MLTSVLGQLKAATKIALYLFIAFVVIRLWQDPSGSGRATVDFVNTVNGRPTFTRDDLATANDVFEWAIAARLLSSDEQVNRTDFLSALRGARGSP